MSVSFKFHNYFLEVISEIKKKVMMRLSSSFLGITLNTESDIYNLQNDFERKPTSEVISTHLLLKKGLLRSRC